MAMVADILIDTPVNPLSTSHVTGYSLTLIGYIHKYHISICYMRADLGVAGLLDGHACVDVNLHTAVDRLLRHAHTHRALVKTMSD